MKLAEDFFNHLKPASSRALFLDYDGTLAPFQVERDKAVPYPGVRERLQAIQKSRRTRLVVISGRAVDDLLPLLGLPTAPEVWGSHGWERRCVDGQHTRFDLDPHAEEGLAHGLRAARETFDHSRVEQKPGCIAVHWRGLPEDQRGRLRRQLDTAWQGLAVSAGLFVKEFDGGLELRAPGRHKGMAVDAVLQEMGPGTVSAYLGDDLTDEDAFRALGHRGLSVLVRREHRPTAARLHLVPPEQLLEFLSQWLEATGSPPS